MWQIHAAKWELHSNLWRIGWMFWPTIFPLRKLPCTYLPLPQSCPCLCSKTCSALLLCPLLRVRRESLHRLWGSLLLHLGIVLEKLRSECVTGLLFFSPSVSHSGYSRCSPTTVNRPNSNKGEKIKKKSRQVRWWREVMQHNREVDKEVNYVAFGRDN